MTDLEQRWRALLALRDPTPAQIAEQFEVAQALTAARDPPLAAALRTLRREALAYLRTAGPDTPDGRVKREGKSVMRVRAQRRLVWSDIELTPEITSTRSNQLVHRTVPTRVTRELRRLLRAQRALLAK